MTSSPCNCWPVPHMPMPAPHFLFACHWCSVTIHETPNMCKNHTTHYVCNACWMPGNNSCRVCANCYPAVPKSLVQAHKITKLKLTPGSRSTSIKKFASPCSICNKNTIVTRHARDLDLSLNKHIPVCLQCHITMNNWVDKTLCV